MLATAIEQSQLLSFTDVARATGLHPEILRMLVRNNVIEGHAPYRMPVSVGVCRIDQATRIAAHLEAARRPVEGRGILVSEAAEKYGFSTPSIYLWHQKDWIGVIGTTRAGDRLFNEGDLAFARALADLWGHRAGKPVFPKQRK
jgi:AraC-like DNA-binding protein